MLFKIENLQATGMRQTVDWQLKNGELWLLYGSSGSGKSQLLKSLADLIMHKGRVALKNQTMESMSAPEWRRKVMFFPAETAWWQESVAEHFSSLPADETLQKIGLQSVILQKHPDQLSSGEKQRLALLRGLAFEPNILLLDETSANLDPESTLQVESMLQDYLQAEEDRAAIWISHDVAQRERLACSTYCCSIEELYSGAYHSGTPEE